MNRKEQIIRVFDYEGNFLVETYSLKEAAEATGVSVQEVGSVINGHVLSADNFQFKRVTKSSNLFNMASLENLKRPDNRKIVKYFGGRVICVYNSISEASHKTGIPTGEIGNVLSGLNNTCRKFVFRYIN